MGKKERLEKAREKNDRKKGQTGEEKRRRECSRVSVSKFLGDEFFKRRIF